jgi:hypothetical protein
MNIMNKKISRIIAETKRKLMLEEEVVEDSEENEQQEDTQSVEGSDKDTDKNFNSSIDNKIDSLLISAEKSSLIDKSQAFTEARRLRSIIPLFESQSDAHDRQAIDIDKFANHVARIINNYSNLIDIEQMILNKALQMVKDSYGEPVAESFEDSLRTLHGIELKQAISPPVSKLDVPNAVGAINV